MIFRALACDYDGTLKPGDYVTVELRRTGKRQVATRVIVSELDTR